jgi:hypothetical protein
VFAEDEDHDLDDVAADWQAFLAHARARRLATAVLGASEGGGGGEEEDWA